MGVVEIAERFFSGNERSALAGVLSDAMADNAPLWALTRKSITAELLKESHERMVQ